MPPRARRQGAALPPALLQDEPLQRGELQARASLRLHPRLLRRETGSHLEPSCPGPSSVGRGDTQPLPAHLLEPPEVPCPRGPQQGPLWRGRHQPKPPQGQERAGAARRWGRRQRLRRGRCQAAAGSAAPGRPARKRVPVLLQPLGARAGAGDGPHARSVSLRSNGTTHGLRRPPGVVAGAVRLAHRGKSGLLRAVPGGILRADPRASDCLARRFRAALRAAGRLRGQLAGAAH
mmetsp:Transcript_104589/g.278292  ORF Transcript_104589/g.278292 Transcript_104589/m.278292 type:complete len:234 (+) Transcript_104589:835-1536(+)